jgi:hypothetical protein
MILYEDTDTKIYTYLVHEFKMGDVEDPDLFAAQHLWDWEKTDSGNWVMNNSEPTASWHRIPNEYGWRYEIRAYLTSEQLMYYRLRFE